MFMIYEDRAIYKGKKEIVVRKVYRTKTGGRIDPDIVNYIVKRWNRVLTKREESILKIFQLKSWMIIIVWNIGRLIKVMMSGWTVSHMSVGRYRFKQEIAGELQERTNLSAWALT